jgi:hypothetical protein
MEQTPSYNSQIVKSKVLNDGSGALLSVIIALCLCVAVIMLPALQSFLLTILTMIFFFGFYGFLLGALCQRDRHTFSIRGLIAMVLGAVICFNVVITAAYYLEVKYINPPSISLTQ